MPTYFECPTLAAESAAQLIELTAAMRQATAVRNQEEQPCNIDILRWPRSRPAWHPKAREGLEPARSVPMQEMPGPAAGYFWVAKWQE